MEVSHQAQELLEQFFEDFHDPNEAETDLLARAARCHESVIWDWCKFGLLCPLTDRANQNNTVEIRREQVRLYETLQETYSGISRHGPGMCRRRKEFFRRPTPLDRH